MVVYEVLLAVERGDLRELEEPDVAEAAAPDGLLGLVAVDGVLHAELHV